MSTTLIQSVPTPEAGGFPIAAAALDNLAARVRPGGLMLVALRPDGTVAYRDASAGVFFHRYALPQLSLRDGADLVGRAIEQLSADSGATFWDFMPGISAAAFPCVERKQITGVLVLIGRSAVFELGEDVVRICSRLGLDGQWLASQADQLPGYGAEAVLRQSKLLLSMVSDQVRLAGLERELDSLSGQLANTYEELTLIYQLSSGMKINRRASDFFKQACLDVMGLMSVRGMGVALRNDRGHSMEPAIYGEIDLPKAKLDRLADELMSVLKLHKAPLLIHHLSRDKTFNWLGEDAEQLLAVPLMRQEQVLGLMFGIDKLSGEFDSVDSKLLNSIANESAIYLENAMLFDDVHELMMGLLHSLTSAVDAKDAYTCGHSERVALLSRELAQRAGLSDQLVERIYMAGLLHDVGKIGVPEAVLQKAGRLTPEEFEQMKKHPEIGARILRDVKQIEDIIPGVLCHHERYDGAGYPSGLTGENIPLMGRIICLADCFDAMTSNRTYRKALPLEVALTEIKRCAGTQFDPALTDAFLSIGEATLREVLMDHHDKKMIELQPTLRATA